MGESLHYPLDFWRSWYYNKDEPNVRQQEGNDRMGGGGDWVLQNKIQQNNLIKGNCLVCDTEFFYDPKRRPRKTCSYKCRRIKYLNSTDVSRRKDSLHHYRHRLIVKLEAVGLCLE